MFYLIKEAQGQSSIIEQDEEKAVVLRFLSNCLRGRRSREKGFTYKAVRELENRKYRTLIKTSSNVEYFISECLTVDFKEYM